MTERNAHPCKEAAIRSFLPLLLLAMLLEPLAAAVRRTGVAELPFTVNQVMEAFIHEALPAGGIDRTKSIWQKTGRGAAAGSDMFPGKVDPRYLRFLVECLYRLSGSDVREAYRRTADRHVRYLAGCMRPDLPTWAWGNALEMIGLYHRFHPRDPDLIAKGRQILGWARERRVTIQTRNGVSFSHFPCGYGLAGSYDAGWTNDLSMFGSGLVWMFELTGDRSILDDAVSFAEYFLQPWEKGALGPDRFWHCGTWRDDLSSWVIGPAHFSGFESTNLYADNSAWVFSTMTVIDFLTRLHHHRSDPRYLDRSLRAARWTFDQCQFSDGAVGMCGRDDKWLGFTGDAVSQVKMVESMAGADRKIYRPLQEGAKRAFSYLGGRLTMDRIGDHGVVWVNRTTSTDPLANVAMLWASAVLGWLNGIDLFQEHRGKPESPGEMRFR